MKAILFDLDDTLIPERPAIEAGYAAVADLTQLEGLL